MSPTPQTPVTAASIDVLAKDTWVPSDWVKEGWHSVGILAEDVADRIVAQIAQGTARLADLRCLLATADEILFEQEWAEQDGRRPKAKGAERKRLNRWKARQNDAKRGLKALLGDRLLSSVDDLNPGDKVKYLFDREPWEWGVLADFGQDDNEIHVRQPGGLIFTVDLEENFILLERADPYAGKVFDPVTQCFPPELPRYEVLGEAPPEVAIDPALKPVAATGCALRRLLHLFGAPKSAKDGAALRHPKADFEWYLRLADGTPVVLAATLRDNGQQYPHIAVYGPAGMSPDLVGQGVCAITGGGAYRTDIDLVFEGR